MSKKLIPIIAISMLLASCFGNTTKGDDNDSTNVESENVDPEDDSQEAEGIIRHITVTEYMAFLNEDGEVVCDEDPMNVEEEVYDTEGRLEVKEGVSSTFEAHYTYNEKGQLVKLQEFAGGETTTTEYTYDDKGNLVKEYDPDAEYDIVTYKYDKKGVKTDSYEYSRWGGECLYHNAFTFNNKGQMTKQVQTSLDSGISETTEYTYDDHGNVCKESVSSEEYGNSSWIDEYEDYDEYGNWTTLKRTHTYIMDEEGEFTDYYYTYRVIEYW